MNSLRSTRIGVVPTLGRRVDGFREGLIVSVSRTSRGRGGGEVNGMKRGTGIKGDERKVLKKNVPVKWVNPC